MLRNPVVAVTVASVLLGCSDGDGTTDASTRTDAQVFDDYCRQPTLCQTPVNGTVSVCGHFIDIGTNQLVHDNGAGALCDGGLSPSRSCSIEIAAYDAVDYAANPSTAVALNAGRIQTDDCGRFRIESFEFPVQSPFVALATRNAPSADTSPWIESVAFIEVSRDLLMDRQRLYVIEEQTEAGWVSSAANPFAGETFSQRGVYIPVFLTGEPTEHEPKRGSGVSVAGVVGAAFYFSDSDPNAVTTVDPSQQQTGANGVGLFSAISWSVPVGSGGEPSGCSWPTRPAEIIPGVALVSEHIAEDDTTGEPCTSP